MITEFLIWWHRVLLRHQQTDVINGPTEAGVKCFRPTWQRGWAPPTFCRWFPSDGGHGR